MALRYDTLLRRRAFGLACALGAVMLGLAYLTLAGAPLSYAVINVAALTIGFALTAIIGRVRIDGYGRGVAMLAVAAALLATAWFGIGMGGATRWIALGPLVIQPSLVLLPAMIVSFARARDALSMLALIIAALALAIQPDRAMSAVLAAGLGAVALRHRDRPAILAFIAAMVGFAVALSRPDTLPAMPFVEQVLLSSFTVSPTAGLAAWAGVVVLLLPTVAARAGDVDQRGTYAAFGTVWGVAVLASVVGNYPTPLVGYGASSVIGYLLSLGVAAGAAHQHRNVRQETDDRPLDDQPSSPSSLSTGGSAQVA